MKFKNLSGFAIGCKLTSRRPPQREMTIVMRGRFRLQAGKPLTALDGQLAQGALSAETFGAEDDDRAGEPLTPDDFADFKLRSDVLLRGTCHACYPSPPARPVKECAARFAVGGWSKTIRVVGRRVWTENLIGAAISDPIPFLTMPLTYENSFGGPGHPPNPVGRGLGTPELPNVERDGALLRSKSDRPWPAAMGPVSSNWAERRAKVGKDYGKEYKKTRAPYYSADFDWSYFNAAPADQQLQGYLRGDEVVTLDNLHPRAPSLAVSLPALRARAVVKSMAGQIQDCVMNLDTLFVEPDEERLTLTWRGHVLVTEDDFTDVRTVLLATEPLATPPLPADHYRLIIEAFEVNPLSFNDQVPAEAKPLIDAMLDEQGKPRPPADTIERLMASQRQEMSPEQQAAIDSRTAKLREVLGKGEDGVPKAADDPATREKVAATVAAGMRRIVEKTNAVKAEALRRGVKAEGIEELEALLEDPRVARYINPPPRIEPGPGVDLSDQDLSGQDLSGRDLRGANLAGARLMKTRLAAANLAGANLSKAVLAGADLADADLSHADLTQAVLLEARAARAVFTGATLDQTVFDRADLTGATLAGAKGDVTLFLSATLRGVNARGISLFKALSQKGDLEGADFSGARLVRCLIIHARARGLSLGGALLDGTSFTDSDLADAFVSEAQGARSIWRKATLDRADFSYAKLPDAHFDEASAEGARFVAADLARVSFYRAKLGGADFASANLLRANLNKAQMAGARFTAANLYDARLFGAAGADCDFRDANVKRALFEPP